MDNNFSKILDIFKNLEEGNQFAGQDVGQKPGEQWRGTDAGTPGKKLVGASESIKQECDSNMSPLEKKLRARWEATKEGLAEYGMTTGGTTGAVSPTDGSNPQDPNALKKATADMQKNLQTLKSVVPDLNVQKASQALSKADSDQSLTNQDQEAGMAMAPAIADIAKNPQLAGQLKQLIQKGQQQQQGQGTV
jgi:hypothetical protein